MIAAPLVLLAEDPPAQNFLPHRHCYLSNAPLTITHAVTDALIFLSCIAISCTLAYLFYKARRTIPFHWMFLAFGAFILACGATHAMEVVTLWKPYYWLAASIKIVAAIASVATAVALPMLIPRLLAMTQISGEKHSEVSRSEERFRSIFESAAVGLVTADENGNIQNSNAAFQKMLGYTAKELAGVKLQGLAAPEDAHPVDKEFARMASGESTHFGSEKSFLTKTNETVWVNVSFSWVHSSREKPYALGLVENISERREADINAKRLVAERAAREEAENSLTLLNAVLQHLPAGVAILEAPSGRMLLMNRILSSMEGNNGLPAALETSPLLHLLQRIAVERAIERGEVVTNSEEPFTRRDGSAGVVRIGAAPVLDREGRSVAAVVTAADITETRMAENALRTSEKLATVGRLAATIAHEINNPLEAVTNLLYLLETAPSIPAESQHMIALAQQELGRVVHIVRQTLGFYRESSTPVPITLSVVIDDVLGLYSRKLNENRVQVERDFQKVGVVEVLPGEMRQVFSNLVVNAIDAMGKRPGGKLSVRISPSHDWRSLGRKGVRVTLSDNGGGIHPENVKRIFEPFFSTKGEKGTGLGLWVSSGIVHKHNGSIRVRSISGKGTCFSVFIPSELIAPASSSTGHVIPI